MEQKTVFALGFFDGVHLGHQALLAECRCMADSMGCQAGVFTFLGHPDALVNGVNVGLINTPADRLGLLKKYGMDTVVELPFDRPLMNMPYLSFFRMLVDTYHAAGVICGENFRFGCRGEGNAERLLELCRCEGIGCTVVPELKKDGIVISSTHIRTLLERGDVQAAEGFLGHRHILTGTVVPGRHLGHTIGIPTANLTLPAELLTPKFGVYICLATAEGKSYPAVTNVGMRPTVGGHHVTVEPWLLDFDGDLYGKELTLEFCRFLRPENKYPSLEQLKSQIEKDGLETRKFFEK